MFPKPDTRCAFRLPRHGVFGLVINIIGFGLTIPYYRRMDQSHHAPGASRDEAAALEAWPSLSAEAAASF